MYKTILKKRSQNITRRNISPRTDEEEPHTPAILEAPKVAFNIVYPPMNFSRVQNVLAKTIVGAKNWNYVSEETTNAVANWAYDLDEAMLQIDVNNFNYGDTVDITTNSNDSNSFSSVEVNTNLICDANIPRIPVSRIREIDCSNPVAFGSSITGSDGTIDTYSVITDKWNLYIFSENKNEIIYSTGEFETITSVKVIGNTFWCTCPTFYYDSITETNYSLIKGTIDYNSTTHVYTISYNYYFSSVSANKVCLSTGQYNFESIGNWIGILTTISTMYVSNNNGTSWYQIESLNDEATWNDLSITTNGIAFIVGDKQMQIIDIDNDEDISHFLSYLQPENWISCCLQTSEGFILLTVASENSAYVFKSYWMEDNSIWTRLPVNDTINQVHSLTMGEDNYPVYAITTKNYFYYMTLENNSSYAVKYGFKGNYIFNSFNWDTTVYNVLQIGTEFFNGITLQDFSIADLDETFYSVNRLVIWGSNNITLRRNVNENFELTTPTNSGIIWAISNNIFTWLGTNIKPLAQEPVSLFTNTTPINHSEPLDVQPQRKFTAETQVEKNTNIIIPNVGKFVKPTVQSTEILSQRAKNSNTILNVIQKFKHAS